ncbi:MAG TPA: nucleoside triphosphate pyrophosphohydrolase [Candidatus Nitrosotalea sp.]|nr:nucleoside triphosphate pyrophosphohydrolase [Candidatus Nitrosotalea sp.]
MAPDPARPYPNGVEAVFEIARRLRAPNGCPWDQEQTHLSLRPYLLEETYELLEAIDHADDAKIEEELGDVLLQVAMHSAIAQEQGRFDAAQVSESSAAKMVARHPHVFGDAQVRSAEEVLGLWEREKERAAAAAGREGTVLDRVPPALPALAWVYNMQKRAARIGFDPSPEPESTGGLDALARTLEASGDTVERERLLGELLFQIADLARRLKVNPEDALRARGSQFKERFGRMDEELKRSGLELHDMDGEAQQEAWRRAQLGGEI